MSAAAPSECAFLLFLSHALFSVCCAGALAGLLAGGSGTAHQTPGTLDTPGRSTDAFLFAQVVGV